MSKSVTQSAIGTQTDVEFPGGWTKCPNLILDHVGDFSPSLLKVTLVILRETVGWHRPEVKLSTSGLERLAKLSNRSVIDAVRDGVERGIINRRMVDENSPRRGAFYSLTFSNSPYEKSSQVCGSTCEEISPHSKKGFKERQEAPETASVTLAAIDGYPDDDGIWQEHQKKDNKFSQACASSYENMEDVIRLTRRDAL